MMCMLHWTHTYAGDETLTLVERHFLEEGRERPEYVMCCDRRQTRSHCRQCHVVLLITRTTKLG